VVFSEAPKEIAVIVQAPELADDLDGDDFAVGELGPRASAPESAEIERL